MGFTAGVYTPPTGAENAFAGKTIASATWNAIFIDIASALSTCGGVSANSLMGNNTGSTATIASLSVPQTQALLQTERFEVVARGVNLNPGSPPVDTPLALVLPTGVTNYQVGSMRLANASATATTAKFGLFTNTLGTGVRIISSATPVTITTVANAAAQVVIPSISTQSLSAATLFFCLDTAQGAPATGDVIISIVPL